MRFLAGVLCTLLVEYLVALYLTARANRPPERWPVPEPFIRALD